MAAHYVKVSDSVWAELVRVQKVTGVDKHDLADDVFALAGDLEAIAEQHEETAIEKAQAPEPVHSTRAAVLEPTQLELSLEDLI